MAEKNEETPETAEEIATRPLREGADAATGVGRGAARPPTRRADAGDAASAEDDARGHGRLVRR